MDRSPFRWWHVLGVLSAGVPVTLLFALNTAGSSPLWTALLLGPPLDLWWLFVSPGLVGAAWIIGVSSMDEDGVDLLTAIGTLACVIGSGVDFFPVSMICLGLAPFIAAGCLAMAIIPRGERRRMTSGGLMRAAHALTWPPFALACVRSWPLELAL